MSDTDEALSALRREIDAIDEEIHALVMRRTRVIERVRDVKRGQRVKIRPAREAEMTYRLVSRHRGAFPRRDLVRIWRELIVGTLGIEGPFSVAVCAREAEDALWDLARDHFCLSAPMSRHATALQVINAVARGEAAVGVLPMPRLDDPQPWWPYLIAVGEERPRVAIRLPFAGRGNGRGDDAEALVVCPIDQEPTGHDRSLFAFETAEQVPFAVTQAALAKAELPATLILPWADAHAADIALHLVEVDGYVGPRDPRLHAFTEALRRPVGRLVPLGGYAKPLTEGDLGPAPDGE